MRCFAVAALFASAAFATPVPQGIDWDAVEGLDPVPAPTIPIVNADAQQTTVVFSATLAASSVASAVYADPTDTSLKRSIDNSGCAVAPSADDTPENFASQKSFSDAATSAITPAGYYQSYADQSGSSEGVYGYMGYTVLDTYDVASCASSCNAIVGCSSFNIYYERDPSVDPTASCSNPPSTTVIVSIFSC